MTQDKQVQRYSNGRNSQTEPDPEVNMTGKRRKYSQACYEDGGWKVVRADRYWLYCWDRTNGCR
jgi:hypothetical protein